MTRFRPVERICYVIAAVLFASGIVHLGVQAVLGGPWSGPVSWRKPADFGMAFGLTLFAVTWTSTYIRLGERLRRIVLGAFAAASVVEVVAITTQAWRGVPSHFNTTTPLDSVFAFSAAGGGAVIIATSVILFRASLRTNPAVPAGMRLSIRVGFGSLLVGLAIGAVMIAIGTAAARTISLDAAYNTAVVLVPGHAAAMQGILVLPILAWLTKFTDWSDARRTRAVTVACLGFVVSAGVIVVESLLRIDPFDLGTAPVVGTALTAVGALVVAATAVSVLGGIVTRSRYLAA